MKKYQILLPIFAAALVCGCSIGMAPKGPDASDVQAEVAKMPPQQQINAIQHSPMPAAEKEKRIQEIEQKYGIKRAEADASAGFGGQSR